jgi:hypothetical protein
LYACISLVNPRRYDNYNLFKNVFENPIIKGMDKNAKPEEINNSKLKSIELLNDIKKFMLRRTN